MDYSTTIAADFPLTIERTLNKPSILSGLLAIGTESGGTLPAPRPPLPPHRHFSHDGTMSSSPAISPWNP